MKFDVYLRVYFMEVIILIDCVFEVELLYGGNVNNGISLIIFGSLFNGVE